MIWAAVVLTILTVVLVWALGYRWRQERKAIAERLAAFQRDGR